MKSSLKHCLKFCEKSSDAFEMFLKVKDFPEVQKTQDEVIYWTKMYEKLQSLEDFVLISGYFRVKTQCKKN